ncbi:FxDxF family PEP-CTERM protein [Methylobacillus sp.]|uniref:lamin tail domain-containing protein n=1 Tax=Methylobacillus sp. TaxID=56818 RepID=UPI0012C5DDDC|nr:FxDxF family PEP-CTERM protein [Methylobacillus sp.]MPS47706.1 PEP-CTERM sorting domain-containing protein [Methylobacillus sp.]
MSIIKKVVAASILAASAFSALPALANPYNVYITEWSYQSRHSSELGEYIEISNLGSSDVDFTNWSYDDDSRTSLVFNLSDFGIVKAGESVVITEIGADEFRARWGLSDDVKVIGFMNPNLGRNDEINIFDHELNLVDRLTYGDQDFRGSIRARYNSGVPGSVDALGANDVYGWVSSQVGDSEGSWRSSVGDIGSPGQTNLTIAAIPEPETYALMLAGLGLVGFAARRRKAA